MKWRGILALGVAISALAVGIGSAGAKTMLDANNFAGTLANCPPGAAPRYLSLQTAINNIAPGGTVNVCKGAFNGAFTVPVSKTGITITGTTRLSLTAGCSATGTPSASFDSIVQVPVGNTGLTVNAANVTIKNLVFAGGVNTAGAKFATAGNTITLNLFIFHGAAGLSFQGASSTTVSNNCFRNNNRGIEALAGSLSNSTIQSNTFRNNTTSLQMRNDSNVRFQSNFLFSSGTDFAVARSTGFNATGNISSTPGVGFRIGCSTNGSLIGNIINGATTNGFRFDPNTLPPACVGQPPSQNWTVTGNISDGQTGGDSFRLQAQSIQNSTFSGNIGKTAGTNGLFIDAAVPAATRVKNNSFAGNIFKGSTWGCRVINGPANLQNWNGNSNIGKPMNTPGTCFP